MSRRAKLAVADWPATDRAAWERALAAGDLLEEPGPAAHWRPKTKLLVADGYGFWLAWLDQQNLLDRSARPEERLVLANVLRYVTDLQTSAAPNTIVIRIRCLVAAIQVMAPEADQLLVSELKRRLARTARPVRRKADRLRGSIELYQAGIRLMESPDEAPRSEATWYRDGLILALLASRPVRIANLAQIRLGRHLTKHGAEWHLRFDHSETKSHTALDISLPAALSGYLERYLTVYRPRLIRGNQHDALWISIRG